jgi:hypothetical protein
MPGRVGQDIATQSLQGPAPLAGRPIEFSEGPCAGGALTGEREYLVIHD